MKAVDKSVYACAARVQRYGRGRGGGPALLLRTGGGGLNGGTRPCCTRGGDSGQTVGSPADPPSSDSEYLSRRRLRRMEKLVRGSSPPAENGPDPPEFPSDMEQYQRWSRLQQRKAFRPRVDPESTSVLLFPGQGSQFVGMGRKLLPYPGVRDLYDAASEILGYSLLDTCLTGPKSQLDSTVICQPAVFVTSLAAVEKLREDKPEAIENCISAAGFSIGEYAALVFSGAMSFENGEPMFALDVPSGMMTVFCSYDTKLNFALLAAREYCSIKLGMENPVCTIANYLYPECKVIAGNNEALDFIERNFKDFRIKRLKRLPVSGAFHTPLMNLAGQSVKQALQKMELQTPLLPVYTNVAANQYRNVASLARLLGEQVCKPVKWEQTMHVLYARKSGEKFPFSYEVGPGDQLGTLLRMVNLKAHIQYRSIDV